MTARQRKPPRSAALDEPNIGESACASDASEAMQQQPLLAALRRLDALLGIAIEHQTRQLGPASLLLRQHRSGVPAAQNEQLDGLAILATNLKQNLDETFARRLTFTVNFPFPEKAERRLLWEILWPPRADDVDLAWFAREVRLSGGNIRNTVTTAAHLAANPWPHGPLDGETSCQRH